MSQDLEDRDGYNDSALSVFLRHFERSLDWVWDLRSGEVVASQLLLQFLCETIHDRDVKIEGRAHRLAVRKVNYLLDIAMCRIRQAPLYVYVRGQRQETTYINGVQACRRIREITQQLRCKDNQDLERGCIYDLTAGPLDMLQKHTYLEVQTKVLVALGKKLPREITDIVSEHALISLQKTYH